ncbi:MAG: cyclic nucleotide-binding domain-containing protein [Gammaproteobacteria bacterium]|nr:cyclic nucleotide-binding domain-containing protein [Gammaproteobacteria bacterium]
MDNTTTNTLASSSILKELSLDEMKTFNDYLGQIELARNDILFNEGEKSDFMGFIIHGEMEVLKKPMAGEATVLAKLGKGRTIGEMALFDNLPRSAMARAATGVTLYILKRESFDEIFEQYPSIAAKIFKHIAIALSLSLRRTSNTLTDVI